MNTVLNRKMIVFTIIYAAFCLLFIQSHMVACADARETSEEIASSPELAFVGKWISELDGSVLKLTPSSYYYKFNFNGGIRENYGEILKYDTQLGHLELKYYKVLQDGREINHDDKTRFMTYVVEGNVLRKNISKVEFPAKPQFERLIRQEK